MAWHGDFKLGANKCNFLEKFQMLTPAHFGAAQSFEVDWGQQVKSWPMLKNDQLGNCTIASLFHLVQAMSSFGGTVDEIQLGTDDEAVRAYTDIDGYNAKDPSTDQGGDPSHVFHMWLAQGITIAGVSNMPLAVFRLPVNNIALCRTTLAYLGPLVLDVALPIVAQTQDTWAAPAALTGNAAPGSWGGHQLICTRLGASSMNLPTWDLVKTAELNWWSAYVEQVWAIIHPLWLRAGMAPSGFDFAQLIAFGSQNLQAAS